MEAEPCCRKLRGHRSGMQVTSVSEKEDRRSRPHGLNTVELLKIASSALNIGPHHAMQVRRGDTMASLAASWFPTCELVCICCS